MDKLNKTSEKTAREMIRFVFRRQYGFCPMHTEMEILDCSDDMGYLSFKVNNKEYFYSDMPHAGRQIEMLLPDGSRQLVAGY